jgi:hypothetical protein
LESNQRPPGSGPGVTTSSDCPGIVHFRHATRHHGSGRRSRTFMSSFKDCRPTISRSPRVPCGNRTRLAGLEDQCLRRSAKGTKRKERESNPQGSSLGRFRDGCRRPSACPSVSSCGGRNRTCNRLLNREPPYHSATPQRVRTVGFEPTLSGSRNRRIPRLSYVLNRAPSGNRTRTSCMASRQ